MPEVFIQCSSDGGRNYEIKSETINLNEDQVWVEGPWDLGDWKPLYGSMLYCQAYEDDSLVSDSNILSFFLNNFQNEFLGDNILKLSSFEEAETVVPITFYIRKDLAEGFRFLEGVEAEFTCPECVAKQYPPHPYFASDSSVWPVQVFEQCTGTTGPKGMELLSQGFCCTVGDVSKLGDGTCDFFNYNTEVCGFDLGDCLNVVSPSPDLAENPVLVDDSDLNELPLEGAPVAEITIFDLQNLDSGSVCTSIYDILQDRSDIELFYSILNATGVMQELESISNFTLLIPTDAAILSFIEQQQLQTEGLLTDPENLNVLRDIMRLHILVAEKFQLVGAKLEEGGTLVGSLLSQQLLQLVQTETGQIQVIPPNGAASRASVLPSEVIFACEGVVYFIDTVLIPVFVGDGGV
eukprot:TRINITY_DN17181_c0_g1_i2.p1 TRINITY_DN17181_c0_g1~~TRINITY_DN17181_c0_g1_i2.p1  ORF type:complete len:408 (-),score=82.99 TRINITY_DN17181_c0_g1_i2:1812-3035(-)